MPSIIEAINNLDLYKSGHIFCAECLGKLFPLTSVLTS